MFAAAGEPSRYPYTFPDQEGGR